MPLYPASTLSHGKILSAQIVSDFSLTESEYSAGLRMPKHSHQSGFISIATKGAYTERIGSEVFDCGSNSVVFHPPEQSHSVSFKRTGTQILQVELTPDWLLSNKDSLNDIEGPTYFRKSLLNQLGARIYSEYKFGDQFSELALHGMILEMIVEIGRQNISPRRSLGAPRWLKEVEEILCEEYVFKPSMKIIARRVGVGPIHLAREFRSKFGCTIGEYVRRLRVQSACRSLIETDIQFSDLAQTVGFYDQSHFSNTFKRSTGLTPAEYRSRFRSG